MNKLFGILHAYGHSVGQSLNFQRKSDRQGAGTSPCVKTNPLKIESYF
jgi:hypothetical protein